ncbi:hypothetical protein VTN49DRAFT_5539 [Thermomyces lanuginosus]|uniref:uncharacterized protein n=1 Tax=Thermomyces lanuginosus TaxID=5541 RepID=UPI00374423EE
MEVGEWARFNSSLASTVALSPSAQLCLQLRRQLSLQDAAGCSTGAATQRLGEVGPSNPKNSVELPEIQGKLS